VVTSIPEERIVPDKHLLAAQAAGERGEGKLTLGDVNLGVTGGDGSDLSELLEVLDGELVSHKVKHDVLESATAVGEAKEDRRGEGRGKRRGG
jgi:hypothetical protein